VWAVVPPAIALVSYVVALRRDVVRKAAQRAPATMQTVTDSAVTDAPQAAAPPAEVAPLHDADIVPSVHRRAAIAPPERMAG
jgi:hypothetical protein